MSNDTGLARLEVMEMVVTELNRRKVGAESKHNPPVVDYPGYISVGVDDPALEKGLVLNFGTANEFWGYDVRDGEDYHEMSAGEDSEIPRDSQDVQRIADYIEREVRKWQPGTLAKRIAELAQDAFWHVVAKHFPGAPGDMEPHGNLAFDAACQRAVKHWIDNNVTVQR